MREVRVRICCELQVQAALSPENPRQGWGWVGAQSLSGDGSKDNYHSPPQWQLYHFVRPVSTMVTTLSYHGNLSLDMNKCSSVDIKVSEVYASYIFRS
jgi:hypothetical protein